MRLSCRTSFVQRRATVMASARTPVAEGQAHVVTFAALSLFFRGDVAAAVAGTRWCARPRLADESNAGRFWRAHKSCQSSLAGWRSARQTRGPHEISGSACCSPCSAATVGRFDHRTFLGKVTVQDQRRPQIFPNR